MSPGTGLPPGQLAVPFAPVDVSEEEIAEVVASLRSGWLTTGPRVGAFEQALADTVGATSVLAVSSATAAMHLALVALGIGEGDAVITTPLTFCSTVHVIGQVGATPVLVDIEPDTLNLDPRLVADVIEARRPGDPPIRALLPVHYGGHPVDLDAFVGLAREHDLALVEDAAHAVGASVGGVPVGSTGDDERRAVAFSFYASKNLVTGEGGALAGSRDLIDEARPWALHGMSRDSWKRYEGLGNWHYEVDRPGFKYNLPEVAGALGLAQLRRFEAMQARRAAIATRYDAGLGDLDQIVLPTTRPGVTHARHLYQIRLQLDRLTLDRSEFIRALAAEGISASVHFIPIHHHAYYRTRSVWAPGSLPVCEATFPQLVSLPCSSAHTDGQIDRVIEVVRAVCSSYAR